MSMVFIRPCQLADSDAIVSLAKMAGPGMSNLPADGAVIQEKIKRSLTSFHEKIQQPGDEYYFFVLETLDTHEVIGCSAIVANVGIKHPFYNYKVSCEDLVSRALGIHNSIDLLYLANDYNDMSELCALFLHPFHRKNQYGRLLSLARLLFVAQYPKRFGEKLFAEMRGVFDSRGRSPFWEGLAHKFFPLDYETADQLSARGEKQFISDLMPRCPIYVPLLPKETQAVIGEVDPATKPALLFLQREGFRYERYIDIFDGGPVVEAPVELLRSISQSVNATVEKIIEPVVSGDRILISNCSLDFRACMTIVPSPLNKKIILDKNTAKLLQVKVGDEVRYVDF